MAHKVLDLVLVTSLTPSFSSPLPALFLPHRSLCFLAVLPKSGMLWVLASGPLHFLFPLLRRSSPNSSLPYLLQLSFPTSPHQFPLTVLSKIAIPAFPAICTFLSLLRFSSTTLMVSHIYFSLFVFCRIYHCISSA